MSYKPDDILSIVPPSSPALSGQQLPSTFDRPMSVRESVGRASPVPEGPAEFTVVLATINERENLTCLLGQIRSFAATEPEVVIVDDGSSDGTRDVILSAARSDPRVRFVFNDAPRTIVGAHLQAIALSQTEFVIVMDSDLQHPAEVIPRILDRLRQGHDVVVASRYAKGGSCGVRPPWRGLISRVGELLARVTIRNARGLSDPISGFFGMRRDAFAPIDGSARGFETLLFILASGDDPKIAEVPYHFQERQNGQSKVLRGWTFLRVFLIQLLMAKRLESEARRAKRGVAVHNSPHMGTG